MLFLLFLFLKEYNIFFCFVMIHFNSNNIGVLHAEIKYNTIQNNGSVHVSSNTLENVQIQGAIKSPTLKPLSPPEFYRISIHSAYKPMFEPYSTDNPFTFISSI